MIIYFRSWLPSPLPNSRLTEDSFLSFIYLLDNVKHIEIPDRLLPEFSARREENSTKFDKFLCFIWEDAAVESCFLKSYILGFAFNESYWNSK